MHGTTGGYAASRYGGVRFSRETQCALVPGKAGPYVKKPLSLNEVAFEASTLEPP